MFAGRNQSCGKMLLRLMLSHVGLTVIVSIYAIVGAYLFIKLESKYEVLQNQLKLKSTLDMYDSKKYLILDMWAQSAMNHTPTKFKTIATNNLVQYHNAIVESVSNFKYDGNKDTKIEEWTFYRSLLFTVTTMAAIGYGHVIPKTFNGQVFCIFYGMIGVPLLLVFLAIIGDFLARSFRYVYSRGCCIVCRCRRKRSEVKQSEKAHSVFKDVVGNEPYMPTEQVQVPITVNVCVVSFYLMLGGFLFHVWEGWEFHSAAYFSFITLSTIGFGDLVPGNSFDMSKDSAFSSGFKMFVTIVFSLFGMALLSMCINLIQEQIVAKFKWMAKELGINEEEVDPMVKNKYRKTQHEVTITPPDKDGNHYLHNLEDRPLKKFHRRADAKFTNLEEVETDGE